MDTSEPSINGTSACNLLKLASLLGDDIKDGVPGATWEGGYSKRAKETIEAYEVEILHYPWLYASFMPGVVASRLGVKGTMIIEGTKSDSGVSHHNFPFDKKFQARATAPRGGLSTILRISPTSGTWLRKQHPLLRDIVFPSAGAPPKIFICEDGVCREEGIDSLEVPMQGLELGVGDALAPETGPTNASAEVASETEDDTVKEQEI
jgi:hypothetical protein